MQNTVIFQRVESGMVLLVAGSYYFLTGGSWQLFVLFFLVPDVSIAGYLFKSRVGSLLYNVGHSYTLPMGLLLFNWFYPQALLTGLSLIWVCHISLDRTLGYGLKETSSFQDTHLGKIGTK